ncbi:MAG: tetratricopeptide repeat protein [Elusimicrobia bacterium]|nr:tetratricopeptide repeat protein [Elusimicrobiota bacterium]
MTVRDAVARRRWPRLPSGRGRLLAACALAAVLLAFGLARLRRPARPRAEPASRPGAAAAVAAVQERLRADPQDISALLELGILHFEQGPRSYPDAVNELEDARRLGALDARVFYCLGVMYQGLGLYPFAQEEYQKYLRNHPEDKEVRMRLGKLYYRQGDFNSAVQEFERLHLRYAGDPLVVENLGLSLWGAKLDERAAESFRQLKTAGGLPGRRACVYLGEMALQAGRYAEALGLMQEALPGSEAPDFGIDRPRLHSAVAMALQKLGRTQEARDAWAEVLKGSPNDAKAKAALRLLRRAAAKKPKR